MILFKIRILYFLITQNKNKIIKYILKNNLDLSPNPAIILSTFTSGTDAGNTTHISTKLTNNVIWRQKLWLIYYWGFDG